MLAAHAPEHSRHRIAHVASACCSYDRRRYARVPPPARGPRGAHSAAPRGLSRPCVRVGALWNACQQREGGRASAAARAAPVRAARLLGGPPEESARIEAAYVGALRASAAAAMRARGACVAAEASPLPPRAIRAPAQAQVVNEPLPASVPPRRGKAAPCRLGAACGLPRCARGYHAAHCGVAQRTHGDAPHIIRRRPRTNAAARVRVGPPSQLLALRARLLHASALRDRPRDSPLRATVR